MSKRFMTLTGVMLSLVFSMFFTVSAFAQSAEGTYNVAATSAEMGTINFVLVLKKDGDKWAAEIKDSPIPQTVTKVMIEGDKIAIVTDAGGQAVNINGKFDGGKVAGDWSAGDVKGTWKGEKAGVMAAPAMAGPAPKAAGGATATPAGIVGSYDFKIVADGQGEFVMTLIIKEDGGKLVTSVEGGGDLNVTGIEVKEGDVTNMTATYQGNGPIPLLGKRTGDNMGGKWEFSGFSGTWEAKKKK
ncbi:MAG: hypothetical protein KA368_04285 [Acidobacteria bacterium]|nr:hypothetical protein [Acidobacteriota bacterium]